MRTRNLQKAFLLGDDERRSEPVASLKAFSGRLYRNSGKAFFILSICIGVIGYRYAGPMSRTDALHNASMILSSMGCFINKRINL